MTALKRARQWRTASRLVVPAKKAQAEEPHPTGKREPYLDFLRRTLPERYLPISHLLAP